jgi:alpha-ribazole phosphatase
MDRETYLWLIRHAPVDGPRGVIHAPDAPADLDDAATFAALQARLPSGARTICSPARRTRETAARLGLTATEDDAFREQDFGTWTGRRHSEIEQELGAEAYRAFWQSPGINRPPGGESFADQIARARELGLRVCLPAMSCSSCIPAPSARSSRSRSNWRRSMRCAS